MRGEKFSQELRPWRKIWGMLTSDPTFLNFLYLKGSPVVDFSQLLLQPKACLTFELLCGHLGKYFKLIRRDLFQFSTLSAKTVAPNNYNMITVTISLHMSCTFVITQTKSLAHLKHKQRQQEMADRSPRSAFTIFMQGVQYPWKVTVHSCVHLEIVQ